MHVFSVYPTLHGQLLESVLPAGLFAFTGQLVHEETPAAENLAAGHIVH